ncbi:MAG: hypothetical protein EA361_11650, partial [Bacteroidetes bacterium]
MTGLKFSTAAWVLLIMGLFVSFSSKAFKMEIPEIQAYLNNWLDLRNQNWAISQSPDNHFIYFANSEGLIEFNGISRKTYALQENLPVRSVLAHEDGKIFTGSFEEYGYWVRSASGELSYTSLSQLKKPDKNDEIWKIFTHGGKIYFQSFTSIYIYNNEKIEQVKAPYTMLFMHQVADRFIVQVIDSGLYWFENGEFTFIENSELFAEKKVHAIIPHGVNQWLIGTDNAGLYLYDENQFRYFPSEASEFLKNYNCNTAKQLNDSTYAFGSILNGVIITDNKGNIQRRYNANNGLNNNTVLSMLLDADMGLWIGLDEGASYIDLHSPFTFYKSLGGTLGTIYALLEKDNILYIGTNHGLFKTEILKKGHIFSFYNLDFIQGSQGQVWTLEEIDGQIICGHNEGTFLVRGNQLELISSVTGGWAYTPLAEYVIGGTYTGIIVMEKDQENQWQFRNKIEGFQEPIRYLETDYLGYVWASHHQKGVYKIELTENLDSVADIVHFSEIENITHNIKVFKINNRVVFTTGENIYTWDFVRSQIIPFQTLTNDLEDFAHAAQISHFHRNLYWFFRDDKIALFEISLDFSATKIMEISQENINLPQRKIQLVTLENNTHLIPSPQNFYAFNVAMAEQRDQISRLQFEKLIFYGRRDTLAWYKSFSGGKIPSQSNNLTVFFADPSNFSLYPRTWSFRIRELDLAWQTTTRNQFTYLDLKHGKYTLEIMSDKQEIIQSNFSIAKPFLISNTAMVIYVLALLALIWGLFRFFRFEISRQREMVAMEVKQNSLEKELDYKSYELMLTMRHLLLKDNILNDLKKQITTLKEQSAKYPVKHINNMERVIEQGLGTQSAEWENAMNNLKLSQQGFFKVLKENYP